MTLYWVSARGLDLNPECPVPDLHRVLCELEDRVGEAGSCLDIETPIVPRAGDKPSLHDPMPKAGSRVGATVSGGVELTGYAQHEDFECAGKSEPRTAFFKFLGRPEAVPLGAYRLID